MYACITHHAVSATGSLLLEDISGLHLSVAPAVRFLSEWGHLLVLDLVFMVS